MMATEAMQHNNVPTLSHEKHRSTVGTHLATFHFCKLQFADILIGDLFDFFCICLACAVATDVCGGRRGRTRVELVVVNVNHGSWFGRKGNAGAPSSTPLSLTSHTDGNKTFTLSTCRMQHMMAIVMSLTYTYAQNKTPCPDVAD